MVKTLCRMVGAVAFMLMSVAPVSAQEKPGDSALTARSVFVRLQSPALEFLKPTSRLDMLDYWDADSVYRVRNAIADQSWLDTVTPDYLRVNITPVSNLQLKILPLKKGNVVMSIYTIGGDGQAPDSSVEFYDPATLTPLDASKFFKAPDLKAFFELPKGSATTMKELREMIPFETVEYIASSDTDELKARLTVASFLNIDDRRIVELFLLPEVKASWKNGTYRFK